MFAYVSAYVTRCHCKGVRHRDCQAPGSARAVCVAMEDAQKDGHEEAIDWASHAEFSSEPSELSKCPRCEEHSDVLWD